MLKRTPLFEAHRKLGARLVDFGGWEMPVQYTGILDEHQAVRAAGGIFDISHMGEVLFEGPEAAPFLNRTLTNDVRKLTPGQGQYTLMCNERGGVLDDLYVYRLAEQQYLAVINASRIDADTGWLKQQADRHPNAAGLKCDPASDRYGAVAVQGPRARDFIDRCFPGPSRAALKVSGASVLKKNEVALFGTDAASPSDAWVACTGYTGEDGFEVIAPAERIERLWTRILELGGPFGLKPCGLGARDTLRTEMGYPLYGHELDENTTPIEAGLGFFVALDKGEFVGRAVLAEQKEKGVGKKCVAFTMSDKSAPPRPHYPIWSGGPDEAPIGEVVSGTQSPSLGVGIGLGYVPPTFARAGTILGIEIRGRRFAAAVVPKPIYRKPAAG